MKVFGSELATLESITIHEGDLQTVRQNEGAVRTGILSAGPLVRAHRVCASAAPPPGRGVPKCGGRECGLPKCVECQGAGTECRVPLSPGSTPR